MHEWALAEAVISTAQKTAEKESIRKITEIKVTLGELQQIDKGVFEFLLNDIVGPNEPLFKDAAITIETDKAVLTCRNCGHQWPLDMASTGMGENETEAVHFVPELAHAYVKCPECQSPDFEIIKGRGVWIDSISGVK